MFIWILRTLSKKHVTSPKMVFKKIMLVSSVRKSIVKYNKRCLGNVMHEYVEVIVDARTRGRGSLSVAYVLVQLRLEGGTRCAGSSEGRSCPSIFTWIRCMASANSSSSRKPSLSMSDSFQILPSTELGSFDFTISVLAAVDKRQSGQRGSTASNVATHVLPQCYHCIKALIIFFIIYVLLRVATLYADHFVKGMELPG